jgi:outer membrane protein assembly factor BamE (lipoprotein component of BamABCDE complex)
MVYLVKTGSVLLLLVFVAFLALGGGVYLGIRLAGGFPSAPNEQPQDTVYSRDEFTSQILGQTPDEVRELLGTPAKTSEDPDAEYWHYRHRTRDAITGRLDEDVQIVFRNGKVADITY